LEEQEAMYESSREKDSKISLFNVEMATLKETTLNSCPETALYTAQKAAATTSVTNVTLTTLP
jgi:hypothetical protein